MTFLACLFYFVVFRSTITIGRVCSSFWTCYTFCPVIFSTWRAFKWALLTFDLVLYFSIAFRTATFWSICPNTCTYYAIYRWYITCFTFRVTLLTFSNLLSLNFIITFSTVTIWSFSSIRIFSAIFTPVCLQTSLTLIRTSYLNKFINYICRKGRNFEK